MQRLLAVMSVLFLIVLGVAHHGSHGPDPFDRSASAAVRSVWPEAGLFAYRVDALAAPLPAAIITAVLVVGCLLAHRWRLSVVAAIGPLAAAATATVLKPLVGRTIHGENLAFPSGHTAFATGVALVVGLFACGMLRVRPGRAVGSAVLGVVTVMGGAAMALDQVILDAHYPSDTVGGFLTAIAVVSLVSLLTDSVVDRLRSGSQAGPEDHQAERPGGGQHFLNRH